MMHRLVEIYCMYIKLMYLFSFYYLVPAFYY